MHFVGWVLKISYVIGARTSLGFIGGRGLVGALTVDQGDTRSNSRGFVVRVWACLEKRKLTPQLYF